MSDLTSVLKDIDRTQHSGKLSFEVKGLPEDIVQNILPVLFPSYDFVSSLDTIDNCVGVHGSISFSDSLESVCSLKWNIQSDKEAESFTSTNGETLESLVDLCNQAWNWLETNSLRLY